MGWTHCLDRLGHVNKGREIFICSNLIANLVNIRPLGRWIGSSLIILLTCVLSVFASKYASPGPGTELIVSAAHARSRKMDSLLKLSRLRSFRGQFFHYFFVWRVYSVMLFFYHFSCPQAQGHSYSCPWGMRDSEKCIHCPNRAVWGRFVTKFVISFCFCDLTCVLRDVVFASLFASPGPGT